MIAHGTASAAIALEPRTPSSYGVVAGDVDAIRQALEHNGWSTIPTRSPYEHSRLLCGGALIVMYASGAIVTQGRDPDAAHRALAPYVRDDRENAR